MKCASNLCWTLCFYVCFKPFLQCTHFLRIPTWYSSHHFIYFVMSISDLIINSCVNIWFNQFMNEIESLTVIDARQWNKWNQHRLKYQQQITINQQREIETWKCNYDFFLLWTLFSIAITFVIFWTVEKKSFWNKLFFWITSASDNNPIQTNYPDRSNCIILIGDSRRREEKNKWHERKLNEMRVKKKIRIDSNFW